MSAAIPRMGLALALLGLGCPRADPKPPPPVAPADPGPPAFGPDVFVQATGTGATEDEAYAAARVALAEAVLGDASWAQRVSLDLHRRGRDPQRMTPTEGGVEVALGLTRARVSVAVSDFENGEPAVQGPEVWREPLSAYLRAHVAARACERRTVLFDVECEPGQTDEADAAVVGLLGGLVLASPYPDGVPVDAEGRPLRAPAVFTLWAGVPVTDLPLRIETEDEALLTDSRVHSDAQGRARIALVEGSMLPSMRVVVDVDALLGPHSLEAPPVELRIEPRATGTRRWAMVVTPGAAKGQADGAAAALRARMKAAGLGAPKRLAKRDIEAVRTTSPARLAERVASIADAMSGSIDLLMVLTYETHFASRMGGGRVWYEAEGTLRVLDVWTGQVRAQATTTVRADGVGDAGADAAARKKLATALAVDVVKQLR